MRCKLLLSLCMAVAMGTTGAKSSHAFDWLGRIELEAEGLDSDDPQVRLGAVRDLQRYAIEWTRKHLLRALEDPDVNVRSAAGRVLAKHNVVEAVPTITRWLAESDAQSKQVAADILGELGAKEGLPALIRSLGDQDPAVRVHAVLALGKIGGESIIVPLVTRLEDDKPNVRQAAVQKLQELGDARAVVPLVGLFDDSSLDVRIAAITAVGFLKDPTAVPALLRELGGIESVKVAAVTALGNLQAKQALPELLVELGRVGTALRGKVAYSMAQIATAHPEEESSRQSLTRLVELLAEARMRHAAKEALLVAGPAAVPRLIDHLNGQIKGHPPTAVQLLLELADKRATPALIAELDRGRISQSIVLDALSKLGDSRALLPVLALLEDSDPKVRLQAMQTLGPMLGSHNEAADVIADHLKDSDPLIQELAARYLGQTRSRAAVPALSELVRSAKSPGLQATALVALGEIGDSDGAEVALRVLEEGPDSLRPIAADVLSELGDSKAVARLLPLAKNNNLPYQSLAIEALGATLRDSSHAGAASLLRKIAMGSRLQPALAAVEALAGMGRSENAAVLIKLAKGGHLQRKRAALSGLGALRAKSSIGLLRESLRTGSDSLAAAAAWSLAEIGDSASLPHLVQGCKSQGSATVVNSSAALARMASKKQSKLLVSLLHHRNPLVRINAIMALARLKEHSQAKRMIAIMTSDRSWLARVAAIRSLSMLGLAQKEIASVSQKDHRLEVRQAAAEAGKAPFAPAARENWTVFRVVDAKADDKAVAQEARFFVGSDGIATAAHTDQRGRIVYEHFPAGSYVSGALSDLRSF
jgi:HEAT repeat protein